MENQQSATTQVAALEVGDIYTKVRFIPGGTPNLAQVIRDTRRSLMQTLSPVLARARSRDPEASYAMHSAHSFTRSYDVIVTAIVIRELGL